MSYRVIRSASRQCLHAALLGLVPILLMGCTAKHRMAASVASQGEGSHTVTGQEKGSHTVSGQDECLRYGEILELTTWALAGEGVITPIDGHVVSRTVHGVTQVGTRGPEEYFYVTGSVDAVSGNGAAVQRGDRIASVRTDGEIRIFAELRPPSCESALSVEASCRRMTEPGCFVTPR